MTEWKQFVHPNFDQMHRLMRRPVVFDGRNLYDPKHVKDAGFTYYSIGRPTVHAESPEVHLPAMEAVGG